MTPTKQLCQRHHFYVSLRKKPANSIMSECFLMKKFYFILKENALWDLDGELCMSLLIIE